MCSRPAAGPPAPPTEPHWVYRLRAGGNVSSVTAAARGGRARTPMRCRSRAWPPRRRRRGSGWLVLWFDAVLAEQGAEPLDLVGELLASLGQNRQRRVPGGPLFLPCGLAGEQFLFPVTQRRGLLILLGIGGREPARGGDPVRSARQGHWCPVRCLPAAQRPPAGPRPRPGEPAPRESARGASPRLLAPGTRAAGTMTCWRTRVQVGAQPDQHLRGHAVALADQAQQDVLGADVVVAELQRLAQRQLRRA